MKTYNLQLTTFNKIFLTAFILSLSLPILIFAQNSESGILSPINNSGSGIQAPSVVKSGGNQSIQIPNPLGNVRTFGELINRLVNWLLYIGVPILTLMIIIGAFQIMTGAGEPEKITKGRHTITYAIIGYALLLISTGITKIISDVLGKR